MLEALRIILTSGASRRDTESAHQLDEEPLASSTDVADGDGAVSHAEDRPHSVADG